MERDFSRDLTIMVAGTGEMSFANIQAELEDWVFGNADSREVKMIFPILKRPMPVLAKLVDWAISVEADVQVVQTKGGALTRDLAALPDIITFHTEQETLDKAFELLHEDEKNGNETVALFFYNEDSVYTQGDHDLTDLEILSEAKGLDRIEWLQVLNAEVMADTFPGYETPEEKAHREAVEAEFAAKQAAEKEAAKRTRAPRKTAAAKKTTTDTLNADEKPLTEASERIHEDGCTGRKNHRGDCVVPEHKIGDTVEVAGIKFTKHSELPGLDKLVADAVARDKAQPKEETDDGLIDQDHRNPGMVASADVVVSRPELVPVTTEDVWNDVAKARPSAVSLRQDELLMELGENIAAMGDAFSKTIRTYAALIEERNA